MKISYEWLKGYFEKPLLTPEEVARVLTLHAFEVEGVEVVDGDTVLDIDVLPNRAHDCLSHNGIARELGVLLEQTAAIPEGAVETDTSVSTAKYYALAIENPTYTRRAMKRLVEGVVVGPSPLWLKERLEALGQRSINAVVDATNYVTLETGQPVHAFDADKITGNITVRFARAGEALETLDGDEFALTEEDLVIADDEKALDIAGVKGGAHSGIDENTTRVLLSVCNFNPVTIRKTSQRLKLKTEASKRFENGLTPELTAPAMERLTQLVVEIADGRAGDVLDEYPRRRHPYMVGVSTAAVNRLLGAELLESDVRNMLARLGYIYKKVMPREVVVRLAAEYVGVPYKYGASISYDAPEAFDCSSFTAFLYANAGIPIPRMTVDQLIFGEPIEEADLQEGDLIFSRNGKDADREVHTQSKEFLPETLVEEGVDHVGVYLGDGKVIHASGGWHKGEVVIENLSETPSFKALRGFRRVAGVDEGRFVVTVPAERLDLQAGGGFLVSGNPEDLIEEIGRVYGYENIVPQTLPAMSAAPEANKEFYWTNKIRDILVEQGFSEVQTYTFQESGEVELENPMADDKRFLRKSLVPGLQEALEHNERYKDLLGVENVKIFEVGKVFSETGEGLHLAIAGGDSKASQQTLSDALGIEVSGVKIGSVWEIDITALLEKLKQPTDVGLAEIDTNSVQFTPISPYPFVLRDVAVWTTGASADGVEALIHGNAGEWLVRATLFDEFEKDGRTSYAFHLVFQSYDKTLSDEEVNVVMEKVESALNAKAEWEVR